MGLPTMLAVDEDRDGLTAVERQLRRRYAPDYRVECHASADDALATLTTLAEAGEQVALVLAARSPSDSAGELFDEARRLHPHARRALLVPSGAWTDEPTADAIRRSMALGYIDHCVLRPSSSPDEVFHEAISSFLLEWARERRTVPQTIHIVGTAWSGRAFELREVLGRCAIPHSFWLADSEEGRELLARAGEDARLPLLFSPGGRVLSDPSNAEIAEIAGAPRHFEERTYDVVIVGAGPAGLSAAVYGASDGLSALVVDEGGIGGQATASSLIRNYLGFAKGVTGSRLAEQAYEQAMVFGAGFVFMHRASGLERTAGGLRVWLSDGRGVDARAVILATGASYRRLDVPSLEALHGAGVFYGGSISEAPGLGGKDVFIAGGGNSAGQAALHLARYARRVTLLVRADSLATGMSHYLVRAVEATPNVDVRTSTTVVGGGGDAHLRELVLRDAATAKERVVAADALFVLIGARPHSEWLPDDLARDAGGFVLTGEDVPARRWPLERRPFSLESSMPGVLAAGDVRHEAVKRVASAVGEGAGAVQQLHALLGSELRRSLRDAGARGTAPAAG